MNFLRLKTKRIRDFFRRLPRFLAERAFLTFIGMFLVALALTGIVFYKYSILAKRTELKITDQQIVFPEEIRNSVVKIWEEREEELKKADSENYSNPFK